MNDFKKELNTFSTGLFVGLLVMLGFLFCVDKIVYKSHLYIGFFHTKILECQEVEK